MALARRQRVCDGAISVVVFCRVRITVDCMTVGFCCRLSKSIWPFGMAQYGITYSTILRSDEAGHTRTPLRITIQYQTCFPRPNERHRQLSGSLSLCLAACFIWRCSNYPTSSYCCSRQFAPEWYAICRYTKRT